MPPLKVNWPLTCVGTVPEPKVFSTTIIGSGLAASESYVNASAGTFGL